MSFYSSDLASTEKMLVYFHDLHEPCERMTLQECLPDFLSCPLLDARVSVSHGDKGGRRLAHG